MEEIQIQKIFAKAKTLGQIIDEPLATKVSEIELNAASAQHRTGLMRLIKGLEQYINKEQSLIYIGFVGHYSSGKSSTINNLLGLKGTNGERATGLNPTDKAITLITENKNSGSLVMMNKESKLVPVRTLFIENPLLRSLVIADTPGSGDPEVINEMIQDFLPVCDYILYFISSTNPMDLADLPLLQQKNLKLPFIPLQFIITRSDEFRNDKSQPLNSENLDVTKKDTFTGQLLSRIKQFTDAEELTTEDFMFIDNDYNYQISELSEKIKNLISGTSHETLLKNHGHKVEYYKQMLQEIESYFTNTINEKIRISRDFVKTANENIKRFDNSVELNNEKLKQLWAKSDNEFKNALNSERSILTDLTEQNFPRLLNMQDEYTAENLLLEASLEGQSTGYLGTIVQVLNQHFRERINEIKRNAIANIQQTPLTREDIGHLFLGRIDLDSGMQTLDIDFSKLNAINRMYSSGILGMAAKAKSNLIGKIQTFKSQSTRKSLVETINKLYNEGSGTIIENFGQYFERIQMYKNTVLTRNTKETIGKLRIGMQLDQLDDDFPEQYTNSKQQEAIEAVYYPNSINISTYETELQQTEILIAELRKETERINTAETPHSEELQKEKVDITTLVSGIVHTKEQSVNMLYQQKISEVLEQHRERYQKYHNTQVEKKVARKKAIYRWTIGTAIATFLIYAALYYLDIKTPQSMVVNIIIGIVTTGICAAIARIFVGIKTDLKTVFIKNTEEFQTSERTCILQLLGEDFWDSLTQKAIDERTAQMPNLKQLFTNKIKLNLDATDRHVQEILDELYLKNNRLLSMISAYNAQVNNFYNKFSGIFADSEKNLKLISAITQAIKARAIEPSFELLHGTTADLEKVKAKIESLSESKTENDIKITELNEV